MESNHTSDEKVGRPRSGSPICLSRVRLHTELDKVFLPINHKITISEKEKQPGYERKERKFALKDEQRRRKLFICLIS